ncbi:MAG: RDD family protein [Ilumatobacter sp.]
MQTGPLPHGCATVSPWGRLGAYFLEGILGIVTLGIGWLIWAAMIAGTGQTPAKRLLKQRVIGADTLSPVSFGKMFFLRGLVAGFVAGFAISFTLGILLFMPFWDKRNQNIWDKVSNTYVVSDPNDAWGTKPTGI